MGEGFERQGMTTEREMTCKDQKETGLNIIVPVIRYYWIGLDRIGSSFSAGVRP